MKSYAETKSTYVYNWPNIIYNLKHRLGTVNERKEWDLAARSWVTCACGNLCNAIPRSAFDGQPVDGELYHLGKIFYEYINKACFPPSPSFHEYYARKAANTMQVIEKRSAELLLGK